MGGIMRRVGALVLSAAMVAAIAGCGGRETAEDGGEPGSTVKIGAVLSMTGTYAALGTAEKNALDLEVKRINDAGGIDGSMLEIVIEDDATDEAKAVAAATKLIEQDGVVAVIGASGTGQSMAMRGDVQRAGVPQVSLAGGTVVTGDFDELVFQTPWSNTIVVPFVLDAIKSAGQTKVGLISDSGGYGKDGRGVILEVAKTAGIDIVADETFNPGDTDLTAQLTNVKSAGAEAVLLWTAGKEAAIAMKSGRELGMEQPFYGGSGQAKAEFAAGAGDAAEGFVFGTGKSLVPANWGEGTDAYATVNDFATRYEAAYGEAPDIFAGHAFDALRIIVDALQRAGADADSAALRDAIEQTSGLVGFGGTFTFSPTDHNGLTASDLSLYRVENGTWVTVQ